MNFICTILVFYYPAKAQLESMSAAHIDEKPGVLAAAKGYWHDGLDISELETEGPELMVGVPCRKGQKEPSFENVDPEQATARQKMQHKLQTESGKKTYGLRGRTVEPVFGQIKAVMGCRTFLRRGIAAAKSEWLLIYACLNLRKGRKRRRKVPDPVSA